MSGRPLRVVVADDEEDIVLLVSLQLEAAGLDVVGTARDGVAVVEQCRTLQPDVVVVDLLMPRQMGIAAIERIKAEVPGVGVVAFSATAGEFVRDETARLGVPLVLKSGDPTGLLEAIRAAADEDN